MSAAKKLCEAFVEGYLLRARAPKGMEDAARSWAKGEALRRYPDPKQWRCKGCGKLISERKVDRNLTTGVDEHWNDWEGTEIPGHPGWCGPVVEGGA